MRGYLLFLLFFYVAPNLGAQNYVSFPTDSARWKVMFTSSALGCQPLVAEYQYTMEGDTIFSSVTYKKIFRTGYTNNSFCYYGPFGYIGSIREDNNKHIYLRLPNSNSDTLIYDFNLSVGDTVKSYLNYNCIDPITVISIDSILIQTTYRKRLNLYGITCGVMDVSIIEGIGSTRGLLDYTPTFESVGTLECFSLREQTIYPDTTSNCPILITGLPNSNMNKDCAVKLICTPNEGNVEFTNELNPCSFNSMNIYNGLGQLVKSVCNENLFPFVISTTEIGTGIFIGICSNNTGQSSAIKFVLK